jgi:hypothetical protein
MLSVRIDGRLRRVEAKVERVEKMKMVYCLAYHKITFY